MDLLCALCNVTVDLNLAMGKRNLIVNLKISVNLKTGAEVYLGNNLCEYVCAVGRLNIFLLLGIPPKEINVSFLGHFSLEHYFYPFKYNV